VVQSIESAKMPDDSSLQKIKRVHRPKRVFSHPIEGRRMKSMSDISEQTTRMWAATQPASRQRYSQRVSFFRIGKDSLAISLGLLSGQDQRTASPRDQTGACNRPTVSFD